MNKKRLFLFIIIFFISQTYNFTNATSQELPKTNSPDIEASSAILIDSSTGQILYQKNINEPHYPASITKLMTALLTIENLEPEDTVNFSEEAILSLPPGSSSIGMRKGEILTVNESLYGLLLMSGSEIANSLAERVSGSIESFTEDMTTRAKELGAKNTNFINTHGIHNDEHYTTAYDMALITKELIKNEYFLSIMSNITYQIPATNKSDEVRYLAQNHKLMNHKKHPEMFRDDVIGGKTGYTSISGHTLVTIAEKEKNTFISVVLNSSSDGVYNDTNVLLDYGFDNFESVTMSSEETIESVPVFSTIEEQSQVIGNANIIAESSLNFLIDKNINQDEITSNLNTIEQLSDTAQKGDKAGTITYYYNNQLLGETDLIINELTITEIEKVSQKTSVFSNNYFRYIIIVIFLILTILLINKRRQRKRNHFNVYRPRRTIRSRRY